LPRLPRVRLKILDRDHSADRLTARPGKLVDEVRVVAHTHGLGQTETTVTLPPGKHTLQLVLGDHQHIPHNPMVASEVITITVK
jgi:hypothetical protein